MWFLTRSPRWRLAAVLCLLKDGKTTTELITLIEMKFFCFYCSSKTTSDDCCLVKLDEIYALINHSEFLEFSLRLASNYRKRQKIKEENIYRRIHLTFGCISITFSFAQCALTAQNKSLSIPKRLWFRCSQFPLSGRKRLRVSYLGSYTSFENRFSSRSREKSPTNVHKFINTPEEK